MNLSVRAIALALGTVGFAASVHAETFVVAANGNAFDQQLERRIEAAGGTITARLPQIGVAIVESEYAGFAERAAQVKGVHSAVADYVLQFEQPQGSEPISADAFGNPPASGEDDFFFDLQWGHAAIDAAGAWNAGYRGEGAIVAVLDSGLYCDHVDIAPNLLGGASFVPSEPDFCNTSGSSHGTHVAGTILAADNGIGTIGVAPEAKLLAVKVLSAANGSGSFAGIIQGIVFAAEQGADVINMSLGVAGGLPTSGPGANQVAALINTTARATRYAASRNALVVASAGNDARDLDHDQSVRAFPAQLPGVLAISATAPTGWALAPLGTSLDGRASYSNYGQSAIDFAAPGGDFLYPGNDGCQIGFVVQACWVFDMVFSTTFTRDGSSFYSWNAGTSMAAPHASGVAALIIGKHGGDMQPAAVMRILRASAGDLGKPGNDDTFGGGRVNAARAVR
ncbi:MAG: S8 family serine peptidase [Proteobacteria bacterium]|nr:S8 family serine peptidase [Pseudomonadota bacterium]